jgi:hypothetical protein
VSYSAAPRRRGARGRRTSLGSAYVVDADAASRGAGAIASRDAVRPIRDRSAAVQSYRRDVERAMITRGRTPAEVERMARGGLRAVSDWPLGIAATTSKVGTAAKASPTVSTRTAVSLPTAPTENKLPTSSGGGALPPQGKTILDAFVRAMQPPVPPPPPTAVPPSATPGSSVYVPPPPPKLNVTKAVDINTVRDPSTVTPAPGSTAPPPPPAASVSTPTAVVNLPQAFVPTPGSAGTGQAIAPLPPPPGSIIGPQGPVPDDSPLDFLMTSSGGISPTVLAIGAAAAVGLIVLLRMKH